MTIFIVALFTIAKIWKQPQCPSTDEWRKCKAYIGVLFSLKEVLRCDNMDVTERHANWNKSDIRTNAAWSHLYVESKVVKLTEWQLLGESGNGR